MGRAARLKARKRELREHIGNDPLGVNVFSSVARRLLSKENTGPKLPAVTAVPANETWDPLWEATSATNSETGERIPLPPGIRMFGNTLYSITVRGSPGGQMLIGYHRRDRRAVRDWRHEQAMKNAIAGPESWAVMAYPPESRVVDSSNEFWLVVRALDVPLPFDFLGPERLILSPEKAAEVGAVQRPWEPSLIPPEFKNTKANVASGSVSHEAIRPTSSRTCQPAPQGPQDFPKPHPRLI